MRIEKSTSSKFHSLPTIFGMSLDGRARISNIRTPKWILTDLRVRIEEEGS